MIWCLSEPGRRHTWNFSLKWLDVSLCWDPQMKSCIVDFKIDSELNSVSQNSPFVTPRWKIQVWATISQGDPPPQSGSQNPSAFIVPSLSLNALYSFNFGSSRAPLRLPHRAACPQDLFFWAQQVVESYKLHCQQAQRTSPHCSDTRSCQSEDVWNIKHVSTKLLSLQMKGATSFLLCRLSSTLAQQEQHCSTPEPQHSSATTGTFSSQTGNLSRTLNSGWCNAFVFNVCVRSLLVLLWP